MCAMPASKKTRAPRTRTMPLNPLQLSINLTVNVQSSDEEAGQLEVKPVELCLDEISIWPPADASSNVGPGPQQRTPMKAATPALKAKSDISRIPSSSTSTDSASKSSDMRRRNESRNKKKSKHPGKLNSKKTAKMNPSKVGFSDFATIVYSIFLEVGIQRISSFK